MPEGPVTPNLAQSGEKLSPDTPEKLEEAKSFHIETEDLEEAKRQVWERITEDLLDISAGSEEKREYHNREHSEEEVLRGTEKIAELFVKYGVLNKDQIPLLKMAAAGHDIVQAGYSDLVPEYATLKNPDGTTIVVAEGFPGRRRRKMGEQDLNTTAVQWLEWQESISEKLVNESDEGKRQKMIADWERSHLQVTFQNEEFSIQLFDPLLKEYTFGKQGQRVFSDSEVKEFTSGDSFEKNIKKPILATKPEFVFGASILPEELKKILPGITPEELESRRYSNGLKVYQKSLGSDSSPQEVALALADLRSAYFKGNPKDAFLDSGNKEWQETRHGELLQLLACMAGRRSPQGLNIEKAKAFYAWDIAEWVRGQVTFALWQRTLTEERIKDLRFINDSDKKEQIQKDLTDMFDFDVAINVAVERDRNLRQTDLGKKNITDTYSNSEILKLLEQVGVKGETLDRLCKDAGVSVEDILSKDAAA